jgi:hypothetical protein
MIRIPGDFPSLPGNLLPGWLSRNGKAHFRWNAMKRVNQAGKFLDQCLSKAVKEAFASATRPAR